MRKTLFILAALSMTCAAFPQKEIAWKNDWNAALQEAKQKNKLVMADFYTDWCGWCKKLDKETYTNPEVIELSAQVVPIKINAEKDSGPTLREKYNVSGYPTIVFINPQTGERFARIVGYLAPKAFKLQAGRIIQGYKDLPDLEKRFSKNPNDGKLNIKLAIIYALQENTTKAESHLGKALDAKFEGSELAQAYNAIADVYQNSDKYDTAIDYFRKAEQAAKDSWDKSYAKLSIVFCYLAKRDNENAKKEVQDLLKMPNIDPDHKKMAEDVLKYLGAK